MIRRMRQAVFEWTGIAAASSATVEPAVVPTEPAPEREAAEQQTPRDRAALGEAHLVQGESATPMRRELVIERILELNPTASEVFLARFSDERLQNYLDRLTGSRGPRGRDARWIRRPESRAAVAHIREA